MPRKKSAPAPEAATLPAVPVIDPNAVYTAQTARAALQLKASTLRREVREGRLRVARRAGRYFILGRWLLEWLAEGELPRARPAANGKAHGSNEG